MVWKLKHKKTVLKQTTHIKIHHFELNLILQNICYHKTIN